MPEARVACRPEDRGCALLCATSNGPRMRNSSGSLMPATADQPASTDPQPPAARVDGTATERSSHVHPDPTNRASRRDDRPRRGDPRAGSGCRQLQHRRAAAASSSGPMATCHQYCNGAVPSVGGRFPPRATRSCARSSCRLRAGSTGRMRPIGFVIGIGGMVRRSRRSVPATAACAFRPANTAS